MTNDDADAVKHAKSIGGVRCWSVPAPEGVTALRVSTEPRDDGHTIVVVEGDAFLETIATAGLALKPSPRRRRKFAPTGGGLRVTF